MSMSFGLGVSLGTSQKLTPQMQQAIKLLQLSSLELEQEVQMKLESNPLLERIEEDLDTIEDDESLSLEDWTNDSWNSVKAGESSENESYEEENSADTLDKLSQENLDEDAIDMLWDEDRHAFDDIHVGAGHDTEEIDGYLGATQQTIQDYVRWQINFKHLSDMDKLIADYLIDGMDDSGFIAIDLESLASNFAMMASFYQVEDGINLAEIEAVLHIIQSCSPTGVGARNLTECLSLQLQKLPIQTPFLDKAKQLLESCHHLVSNNIKALLDETGLNMADIKPALELIRTLDPEPAKRFIDEAASANGYQEEYDVPDVLVTPAHQSRQKAGIHQKKSDEVIEEWRVQLNPATLPHLRVNQEYACLIKRGDDSADNLYLKEHLADARLFIRSIEERNQNLLKVASCIVRRQQNFLQDGAAAMQPMTLKDVAEEVGLHESTVSRLTTNKTILTPRGLFSLKYFFSSGVSGEDGEVSSTAISAMIADMIEKEDPKKPLSDSAIAELLKSSGIDIARRTVTKYREAMNIGSSTQRKQKF